MKWSLSSSLGTFGALPNFCLCPPLATSVIFSPINEVEEMLSIDFVAATSRLWLPARKQQAGSDLQDGAEWIGLSTMSSFCIFFCADVRRWLCSFCCASIEHPLGLPGAGGCSAAAHSGGDGHVLCSNSRWASQVSHKPTATIAQVWLPCTTIGDPCSSSGLVHLLLPLQCMHPCKRMLPRRLSTLQGVPLPGFTICETSRKPVHLWA